MIRRGTTPVQAFTVDVDLREACVYVTYSQGGITKIERTNDTLIIKEDKISFILTQEETLNLDKGVVDVQIRYKTYDGIADASPELTLQVGDILKDGEI